MLFQDPDMAVRMATIAHTSIPTSSLPKQRSSNEIRDSFIALIIVCQFYFILNMHISFSELVPDKVLCENHVDWLVCVLVVCLTLNRTRFSALPSMQYLKVRSMELSSMLGNKFPPPLVPLQRG